MIRLLVFGALGLLLGSPAWAANGDACGSTQFTKVGNGKVKAIWCLKVLDDAAAGAVAGSGGPIELDFTGLPASTAAAQIDTGLPDEIIFKVGFTDCTAGTVTMRTTEVSGGAFEDLIAASSDLDVDATSPAGNTAVRVNLHDIPLSGIVKFRWTGATCTSGFDILAIGYERTR